MAECRWLKPRLAVNIEYLEWTAANHLRHAVCIETGSRKPPNDQLIDQLGTILGIPVEILYYQAERMPADLIRDDISEEGEKIRKLDNGCID
jgi:hypothetical protein